MIAEELLPAEGRKTRAVVDLDAIRHNVGQMHAALEPGVRLAAVVKANAYGHGAVEVSFAALEAGAQVLAVAMAEEAVPLREAGIDCPILVIGPSNEAQMSIGVRLGLDLCIFRPDMLARLEHEAERQHRDVRIHLKMDTGMGRIGMQNADELNAMLHALDRCRRIEMAGMFTHLACADEYDNPVQSHRQMEAFMDAAAVVRRRGYNPLLHASNSAAAQNLPNFDLDMVRFGISLYGYEAGTGKPARELSLRPAMQVEAEVSVVREVPAGSSIGYGATFHTTRPSRIATVQIGYGDGYSRALSNEGRMIVQSTSSGPHYAPVVGRVCMDMTMLDVTDLPNVHAGDRVLAMGRAGNLHWDAQDIAHAIGTISYEVLCCYGSRIPRVYLGATERGPNR